MKSVISTLLLTVMLTVTIGVPVFRHTCHVSDRSELSVLTKKQCCASESDTAANLSDLRCCTLEQFDTSFDYETLVKENSIVPAAFVIAERLEIFNTVHFTTISEPLPVLRPPPLANRELHNRIQLYLI